MAVVVRFFEGYIRNSKKLISELGIEDTGLSVIEHTIIREGYSRWGHDLPDHLYGAFSFVLYDENEDEIFCARDPFGISRLFYYSNGSDFIYSPDINTILNDKRYRKEIDEEVLLYYTMFGYPVGMKTIFKGINKLMPGSCMVYRDNKCTIKRYFIPDFDPQYEVPEQEWIKRINDTLKTILEEDRENRDPGKAYCFLSSGVDSSYLLASSGIKNSCCVGYPEDEASEWDLAGKTASILGADFHRIGITCGEFFGAIPAFVRDAGLPLSDHSSLVFALGCEKLSSSGVKVCFSGEGADEFFAGYHVHKRASELFGSSYYGCFGVMDKAEALRLLNIDCDPDVDSLLEGVRDIKAEDPLNLLLATDISLWLDGDILFGTGNAAASAGIELLLPYLDRRMFELSAKIPPELKLKDDVSKYILRKAASELLPEDIIMRPKSGFPVPVKEWMLDDSVKDELQQVLFGEESAQLFNLTFLRKVWDSFYNGESKKYHFLYTVYIIVVWYKEVFLKQGL